MMLFLTVSMTLLGLKPVSSVLTFSECCVQGGVITYDIGDGSTRSETYTCETDGQPPLDVIFPGDGEPQPREGAVCCGPIQDLNGIVPSNELCLELVKTDITTVECEAGGGTVVGDIGNGAIFQPDYVCESTGLPPIGTIVPSADEPIASDGAVCCGGLDDNTGITTVECEAGGGTVVGDLGNGAIFQPEYVCESTGLPPISTIVPSADEPIAIDGAVCCGTNPGLQSTNQVSGAPGNPIQRCLFIAAMVSGGVAATIFIELA